MPNTYVKIAESTLTTNQSTLLLNNIPQTYGDIVIRIQALTTYTGFLDMYMWANNNTAGIYSHQRMSNDGGSFTVNRGSGGSGVIGAAAGTNLNGADFNNVEIYIPEYAGNKNKQALGLSTVGGGSAGGTTQTLAWLMGATTAISRLDFGLGAGQFVPGTKIYLYGISKS